MKYAIFLLLGVSAWGQTPQQMKEQFPPMPPACVEETEHGWRSIVCLDVSQNAPLASWNQSLASTGIYTIHVDDVTKNDVVMTINGGAGFALCSFKPHADVNCRELALILLKLSPKPAKKKVGLVFYENCFAPDKDTCINRNADAVAKKKPVHAPVSSDKR